MKIQIQSTEHITTIDNVRVRAWHGTTESGIPCTVFVHQIAVSSEEDTTQFDAELEPDHEPREVEAYVAQGRISPDDDAYRGEMARWARYPVLLETDVSVLLVLLGAWQLALRHPQFPRDSRQIVQAFAEDCLAQLQRLSPTLALLFANGRIPGAE